MGSRTKTRSTRQRNHARAVARLQHTGNAYRILKQRDPVDGPRLPEERDLPPNEETVIGAAFRRFSAFFRRLPGMKRGPRRAV